MCRHMVLLHIMLTSLTLPCSVVLILASLLVYNKESLEDFNARAVRLATGKGSDEDMAKTNPRLCESHVIECVSRKAKATCKA